MTSITKTAYPRFKKFYKLQDLEKVFQVTETELQFIAKKARGKSQQLTLLTLLKSHQHLGYLPNLGSIHVMNYLRLVHFQEWLGIFGKRYIWNYLKN